MEKQATHTPRLRWMRLDNAAKIYPAARSKTWSNVFRLSATLTEDVDPAVLEEALAVTVRRFPSINVRLRRGVFWYYLEQLPQPPGIREEYAFPVAFMPKSEVAKCALRVIVYRNRIAVEFFHALTDGTGGLCFLKTLVAEYLERKYGITVPAEHGVLDRREEPTAGELEDSFLKYAGTVNASRKEPTAWRLSGTPVPDGRRELVCLQVPTAQALEAAHRYGVSLTVFLCAAMMEALLELQKEYIPVRRLRRPVKVLLPVNLRNFFPSTSVRNFALYTTPSIDPKLGEYTFSELCNHIHHHMGMHVTSKRMGMLMAANVSSERSLFVKIMPLFIKNAVMKAVFNTVGERKSCLSLSNLGAVKLPDAMAPYVRRMDFILGTQAKAPHNCGVLSWGDTMYINFTRNIRQSGLELQFFRALQRQGLTVTTESNGVS